MIFLAQFAASFLFIALKALQQRQVLHDDYLMIIPTSMCIASFEVFVIDNISTLGWSIPLVFSVGMGSGLGCLSAMYLHRRYRLKGEQVQTNDKRRQAMTPCEERGLSEGQWVWCKPENYFYFSGEWIQLDWNDGTDVPTFSPKENEETYVRGVAVGIGRIDWSQGIHNEKPTWTPREYGGEGPPRDVTNTPHQLRQGDYILREDIPDQATFDAIVTACEKQGILPAGKNEQIPGSEGAAFLLRGSLDLCQWSIRPWTDGRRITPADLGIKAPDTNAIADRQFEAGAEGYDPVDRPEHYASGDIECIEAIQAALTEEEFRGYRKGSVIKYIWRERQKGGVESLRKARWYLDHLIDEQQ